MDRVGVPQHNVERSLSPSDNTAVPPAAGSSGVATAQNVHFHHYHAPVTVNNVGTAINPNFGVNKGVIEQNAHIQCRPSSSKQYVPESGTGASSGGASPNTPGIVVSQTTSLYDLLNPIRDASHTRDRVASPPNSKCFEGTRKKVIKKITSWIDSNLVFGNPHIMWVYGYAGCGKSSIAQVVAEQMSSEGRLAASFFFFRGSGDRDCVARFATTIASQLAAAIPVTAPIIRATIEATPGLLSTAITTLSSQFQHLVYDSFSKSTGKRDRVSATFGLKSFLIVLDGLDECEDRDQVAEFIEHAIKFFNKNTRTPLRFLITSRVENHLYQRLHSSKQVELLNLVEHTSEADIATALDTAIANEKRGLPYACEASWPSNEDKEKLVEHIGGSYIFMTTLIRMLFDQSTDDPTTPMQRLPQLLSVKPDFDSLYIRTLKVSEGLPHFHDITSVIALAQEPLSIVQIADLLNIETFPISRVLANLHSIMQVPGDDRSPVTLWHTSLRDFLTSKDRAGPSYYAHPLYHLYLAFRCGLPSHSGAPVTGMSYHPAWVFSQDARKLVNDLGVITFRDEIPELEAAHTARAWSLIQSLQESHSNKSPALCACAWHGKEYIAHLLLEHGADPNAKDSSGWTPLHNASRNGHVKIMRHLLEFSADPNIQSNSGWTPLHLSCWNGEVEAARLLLGHNADPSIEDDRERTALRVARQEGQQSIIALFRERGIKK